jgi:hypothetical protein
MGVQDVNLRKLGDVGDVEDDTSYGFGRREEEVGNLIDEDA